jgi:hypothetical protein
LEPAFLNAGAMPADPVERQTKAGVSSAAG